MDAAADGRFACRVKNGGADVGHPLAEALGRARDQTMHAKWAQVVDCAFWEIVAGWFLRPPTAGAGRLFGSPQMR